VSRIVNAKRGGNTSGLPFLLAISAATGFAVRWSRFLMSLSIDSIGGVRNSVGDTRWGLMAVTTVWVASGVFMLLPRFWILVLPPLRWLQSPAARLSFCRPILEKSR